MWLTVSCPAEVTDEVHFKPHGGSAAVKMTAVGMQHPQMTWTVLKFFFFFFKTSQKNSPDRSKLLSNALVNILRTYVGVTLILHVVYMR